MNKLTQRRNLTCMTLAFALVSILPIASRGGLLNRRSAASEPSDPSAIRFHQTAESLAPGEVLPVAGDHVTAVRPGCVLYKMHKAGRSVCGDCPPPMKAVLLVENPEDCCCYAVPICLPGCCEGPPSVASRTGLLRRGIVHYRWCCGFEVKIIFRARGDVVVHYYGNFH